MSELSMDSEKGTFWKDRQGSLLLCIHKIASALSPCSFLSHYFQRGGVANQFVQSANEVGKARTRRAVLLPAVQHQLVQVSGAVGWRGQPVVLLYSIDHLMARNIINQFQTEELYNYG